MLVFVYGTLTDPARADAVLDEWSDAGPAELAGLHRVDGPYPTLAPGGRVGGRLLSVDGDGIDRLDAYEGVDDGLYVRVTVPLEPPDSGRIGSSAGHERHDRVARAAVYVGDPDRLRAPAEWPGEGGFERRVSDYLAAHEVVVRRRPDRQG